MGSYLCLLSGSSTEKGHGGLLTATVKTHRGTRRLVVAVTGVGGGVGQAVLRALGHSRLVRRTIGFDMNPESVGLFLCERGFVVPPAADPSYADRLLDVCVHEGVDVLLPGSDPELLPLALAKGRFAEAGVRIVVSGPEAIRLVRDKLMTARFCAQRAIPFARTVPVEEASELAQQVGFPLVVKPIGGSATRDVHVAFGLEELRRYVERGGLIAQEYLAPSSWRIDRSRLRSSDVYIDGILRQEEEISVQLVLGRDGTQLGCFMSRNRLMNGVPMLIEPEFQPAVLETASLMGRALVECGLVGPCNLQGRWTESGIVFFEVNLRFTGITAMRTAMGFQEVEATLRHLHLGESTGSVIGILRQPSDVVCLRYVTEQLVPRDELEVYRSADRRGIGGRRGTG